MGWGLALGVGLGIAVICYGFDKLSEYEREKQRAARNSYNGHREKVNKLEKEYLFKAKEYIKEGYKRNNAEEMRLKKLALDINLKEITEYYNDIKNSLDERILEKEKLFQEVNTKIKESIQIKRSMQNTRIRNKSMALIESQMYEAKDYINGYIKYLKSYKKRLGKEFSRAERRIGNGKFERFELEPFEFLLPSNYPYYNKVIEIDSSILNKEGEFKLNIPGLYHPEKFKISDIENGENFIEKGLNIPLIVEEFDRKDYSWMVSFGKGMYLKSVVEQPGLGIEASVCKVEKDSVLLNYYGVKLNLKRENYLNPRINPMLGSILTVYPMELRKSFKGNYKPFVTENIFESVVLEYIDSIPLLVPESKIEEFEKNFKEKDLKNLSSYSWRVGPFESQDDKIKFQLGESVGFSATIKQINRNGYLEYGKTLTNEEKFKSNDIYMSLNATLDTKVLNVKENLSKENKESMNTFISLINFEFKNQQRIVESTPGILYYNKWTDVTTKLIKYLSKDIRNVIYCEIKDLKKTFVHRGSKIERWTGKITNDIEVEETLGRIFSDGKRIDFFIESDVWKYEVRFPKDGEEIEIMQREDDEFIGELSKNKKVNIAVYPKAYPYPEIQQKLALDRFRRGDIENSSIKDVLLNGENFKSLNENSTPLINIYNNNIKNNIYQKEVVEKAVASKDFFMIQGPPGTGKTTVIKEIILQQLEKNPSSNILITSQTNVAVDNVLKGVLDEYSHLIEKERLIRCGNENRIDPEVVGIAYEGIIKNYKKEISEVETKNKEELLLKEIWNGYCKNENNLRNELGELILRGKKLIGATCVGIAKKRIGLDEMAFDLVIVDEASKALPAEMLIPINKAKKCIIIGDQNQLPPTIHPKLMDKDSIEIEDYNYCEEELFNKSMFERLINEVPEDGKGMLKTQYRMPNTLGNLISKFFYEGKLENGENCCEKKPLFFNKNINWINTSNVKNYYEDDKNGSPKNLKEAEIIKELVILIRKNEIKNKIAIITPYKGQKRTILKKFKDADLLEKVSIDTIDSYQGDEADIVIFATTRAKKATRFFGDKARLNVAFSRAKRELIIIGNNEYFLKQYGEDSLLYNIYKYIEKNGTIQKSL